MNDIVKRLKDELAWHEQEVPEAVRGRHVEELVRDALAHITELEKQITAPNGGADGDAPEADDDWLRRRCCKCGRLRDAHGRLRASLMIGEQVWHGECCPPGWGEEVTIELAKQTGVLTVP